MHKNKFKKIFKTPFKTNPLLNKLNVSKENEEKVVKAPRKPVIKNNLKLVLSVKICINNTAHIPIIKEPITFTNRVPYGKFLPNKTTQ